MTRQMIAPPRATNNDGAGISYREFLRTDFGESARVEWVDGKVVHMAPLSDKNTELQVFLILLLGMFVDMQQLGALRIEPYNMKTGPKLPGRSPDILFVASGNRRRLKSNHLEGPADLVIEVISPKSRNVDRKVKFKEYEKGGVREYWLIDPRRKAADFFRLGTDRRFHPVPVDSDGIFASEVLAGFWLRVKWLWQSPLPGVMSILKELKVV
jgi:Uma2 family endonuclease